MKEIRIILDLINRALNGDLPLDEFYELWPDELSSDQFYETIFNDIESAVEHYPSFVVDLFGKKDTNGYFKESYEYNALLADKKLLKLIENQNLTSEELVEMRKNLIG